jgi:hypothetical protein
MHVSILLLEASDAIFSSQHCLLELLLAQLVIFKVQGMCLIVVLLCCENVYDVSCICKQNDVHSCWSETFNKEQNQLE